MNDAPYNPNDPLFLLSRSLDETLDPADGSRLAQSIASGEVTPAQLRDFRATDALLRGWRVQTADMSTVDLTAAVINEIRAGSPSEDEALDDLLGEWGGSQPNVDWDRFHAGVLHKVGASQKKRGGYRILLRLGLPLAAAAAVVFAVMVSSQAPLPVESSHVVVRIGMQTTTNRVATGHDARLTVSFGRVSVGPEAGEEPAPAISSGWGGPGRVAEAVADLPPL